MTFNHHTTRCFPWSINACARFVFLNKPKGTDTFRTSEDLNDRIDDDELIILDDEEDLTQNAKGQAASELESVLPEKADDLNDEAWGILLANIDVMNGETAQLKGRIDHLIQEIKNTGQKTSANNDHVSNLTGLSAQLVVLLRELKAPFTVAGQDGQVIDIDTERGASMVGRVRDLKDRLNSARNYFSSLNAGWKQQASEGVVSGALHALGGVEGQVNEAFLEEMPDDELHVTFLEDMTIAQASRAIHSLGEEGGMAIVNKLYQRLQKNSNVPDEEGSHTAFLRICLTLADKGWHNTFLYAQSMLYENKDLLLTCAVRGNRASFNLIRSYHDFTESNRALVSFLIMGDLGLNHVNHLIDQGLLNNQQKGVLAQGANKAHEKGFLTKDEAETLTQKIQNTNISGPKVG